MMDHLKIAYALIWTAAALIGFNIVTLFTLRVMHFCRERKTAEARAKFQDYFSYLLTHLDGTTRLRPPSCRLTPLERRVILHQLAEWMERFAGKHREQLAELCEVMGFVEENRRRLASWLPKRRLEAAYYLGAIRAKGVVPDLLRLMETKDDAAAFIIARSVARCARHADELREMVIKLVKRRKQIHPLVMDILKDAQIDTVSLLRQFLNDGDGDLATLALLGLSGRVDPASVSELRHWVHADDKELRIQAVKALLRGDGLLSINVLASWMKHPDWEVRAVVAKALGQFGGSAHIGVLREGLTDPHWWVRRNSAASLAQLGEEGFAVLCSCAASRDLPEDAALIAGHVVQETLQSLSSAAKDTESLLRYNRYLQVYEQHAGRSYRQPKAM